VGEKRESFFALFITERENKSGTGVRRRCKNRREREKKKKRKGPTRYVISSETGGRGGERRNSARGLKSKAGTKGGVRKDLILCGCSWGGEGR